MDTNQENIPVAIKIGLKFRNDFFYVFFRLIFHNFNSESLKQLKYNIGLTGNKTV